jgi:uncharacterized protein (TIGR02246 family)
MSTRYQVVLAIVSFLTIACAESAPSPRDTSGDEAELRRLQDSELAALGSGDIAAMLANYTDDVVMMAPDAAMVKGTAELRAMMEGMLKEMTVTGKYDTADVQLVGDVAIVRYTGEMTTTPKAAGAASVTHKIKGLHMYRRQPDGSWKIAQDVWNNDPAPSPVAARF